MFRVADIAARITAATQFRAIIGRTCAAGAAVLSLTGCIFHTQSYVTDVSAREWRTPAVLTIPNADTTSLRDLYLFLRSNDNAADTLTLHVTFFTPDSLRYEERFLVALAQRQRSESMAEETCIPYRTRVQLQHTGSYRIQLTPETPAAGIEAVGIQIENSNKF